MDSDLKQTPKRQFKIVPPSGPTVEIHEAGYPSLQIDLTAKSNLGNYFTFSLTRAFIARNIECSALIIVPGSKNRTREKDNFVGSGIIGGALRLEEVKMAQASQRHGVMAISAITYYEVND